MRCARVFEYHYCSVGDFDWIVGRTMGILSVCRLRDGSSNMSMRCVLQVWIATRDRYVWRRFFREVKQERPLTMLVYSKNQSILKILNRYVVATSIKKTSPNCYWYDAPIYDYVRNFKEIIVNCGSRLHTSMSSKWMLSNLGQSLI